MTKARAKKRMRAAFATLTKRQRANFAYHVKRKTPILCGDDAFEWFKPGAG